MKLPLYRKLTLHTQLTKQEARQALLDNISKPDNSLQNLFKQPATKFKGYLYNDEFAIERVIHYRNSFLPKIKGRLNTLPNGTEVSCTFVPQGIALVIAIIFLTGTAFATVAIAVQSLTQDTGFYQVLAPLGMLIFGSILITVLFNSEYDDAKKDLITILKSPERESI